MKAPTRGSAVLDKIYTSLKDWYEPPVVLPNFGRSDHSAVVMVPNQRPADRGEEVTVVVRSQDANGRTLLCHAMTEINWTPLYHMATCDEMTQAFYSTVTGLLDYCLPLMTVTRHTTDKPWVTDQFSSHPLSSTRAEDRPHGAVYTAYHNRVQRMSRTLRRKYCARKMECLRASNPRSWWRSVKHITGQTVNTTQPLIGLANQLQDAATCRRWRTVRIAFPKRGR